MDASVPPAARRRAPACVPCRQRKLRCDRKLPCSMCIRSRREECFYSSAQTTQATTQANPAPRVHTQAQTQTPPHVTPAAAATSSETSLPGLRSDSETDRTSSAPAASASSGAPEEQAPSDSPGTEPGSSLDDGQWLVSTLGSVYISGKPQEISDREALSTENSSTTPSSRLSLRQAVNHDQWPDRYKTSVTQQVTDQWLVSLNQISRPIKGIMFKGKYVGQSNWLQAISLVPSTVAWVHQGPYDSKNAYFRHFNECSVLAKRIKSQRQSQQRTGEYGRQLPSKAIADRLLDLYIRNFEPIYRIIHVPTLLSDYDHFWETAGATAAGTTVDALLVNKVQLCLALGSYLHDDVFSLRTFVVQWINEAKSAIVMLEKTTMRLERLQVLCLLHLVRRYYSGKQGPPFWISSGSIYHTAVGMGLHIDPSRLPRMTPLDAELRRRLWFTILEFQIESSLEGGTVPLIAVESADCEMPSNLDDDQLNPGLDSPPTPKPRQILTGNSLQIALARSMPLRASIIKLVNDVSHQAAYGEVLRLTSELQEANRALLAQVTSYSSLLEPFLIRWCDAFIRRYFLILHIPYMQLAARNPLYYFSRKVCVDNAVRMSYAFCPSGEPSSILEALRAAANIEKPCAEFLRHNYCTQGQTRAVQFQCTSVLAAELLSLIREENSGNLKWPNETGEDGEGVIVGDLQCAQLHALLIQAKKLEECRLKAGCTNPKDFVHVSIFLGQVEACVAGTREDAVVHARAMESLTCALTIIREQVNEDTEMHSIAMPSLGVEMEADDIGQFTNLWMSDLQDLNWENLGSGFMNR